MRNDKILDCLEIDDLKIPIILKISNRARHIRFTMNRSGLKIVKPYRASMSDLKKVIKEKEDWIYKHYKNILKNTVDIKEKEWITGEEIFYLGRKYPIKVIEWDKKSTTARFEDEIFYTYIEKGISQEDRTFRIEFVFEKLLRIMAREYITKRVEYYKNITGFRYNEIRIKSQKTLWGSCSRLDNLNFNWKLIMTPEYILDYIVVHELCHLLHMNHSKEYWDTVAHYMPDYKNAKRWLKEHGNKVVL